MTKPNTDKGDVHDALEGLIDVTFDVLRGNVRHASRIFSGSVEDGAEIDLFQELARFWTRAGRDVGRAFNASQEFFERLGSPKPDPQVRPIQTSGSASAASVCRHKEPVGPFGVGAAVQVMPLRHRGDEAPAIAVERISVTPGNVTKGQVTNLQIAVTCGGAARGLYEGTLKIGSEDISYNIYIDPD